jgi:hypothetical protein
MLHIREIISQQEETNIVLPQFTADIELNIYDNLTYSMELSSS